MSGCHVFNNELCNASFFLAPHLSRPTAVIDSRLLVYTKAGIFRLSLLSAQTALLDLAGFSLKLDVSFVRSRAE